MSKRIVAVATLAGLLALGIWLGVRNHAQPKLSPSPQKQTANAAAGRVTTGTTEAADVVDLPPARIKNPAKAFAAWFDDYRAASPAVRREMIAQGVQLAKQRRAWLLELIQNDPEAALAAAFSPADLAALPPEIAALAEQRIDQPAFHGVLAICNHGPDNPHGEGCRIEREVRLGGLADTKRYLVHTYGSGLDRQTEENGQVTGIALDDHMAVAPPVSKGPPH